MYMMLATYQLSSYVSPDKFEGSGLCGEGCLFMENVMCFSGPRQGDFRASIRDYWSVAYFHTNGRMDIEVNHIPQEMFKDVLRDIADALSVSMKLVQPQGYYDYMPSEVLPNEVRDAKEVRDA